MQPILVSYPMGLVHLDLLTLGGKTDDSKSIIEGLKIFSKTELKFC